MLELYHTRDAVCPMKVRVTLAEKGLDWTSHLVTDLRSPAYLALNPGGYVPTLIDDHKVLVESRIISEYLEDAYPQVALMPADPYSRHQARLWSKQIDDTLHLNVFILTFVALAGWGISKLSPEEQAKRLPLEPLKRDVMIDLINDGAKSKWVAIAARRFRKLMGDIDDALKTRIWLAGECYSLADIDLGVYAFRLKQMGLDLLWTGLPRAADWIERVHARPAFGSGIGGWLTTVERDRYNLGSAAVQEAVGRWMAAPRTPA